MTSFCGLDFGTSNSALSVWQGNAPLLVPAEGAHTTLPSAIFYPFDGQSPELGREAVETYIEEGEGRLLRGLKSILGTTLFDETARSGRTHVRFPDAIGLIINRLKQSGEAIVDTPIEAAVIGRPVHYVGAGPDVEERALSNMTAIAHQCGIKTVAFQYEPIAAALHYESSLSNEQTVLIVDIGGGTSDFSVVRVGAGRAQTVDRSADILANHGLKLGGTNFDSQFSRATAMPYLGYGHQIRRDFGDDLTETPPSIYIDLSLWHRILFAYSPENQRIAQELRKLAIDRTPFERLLNVMEQRLAHAIAAQVEAAKIALSQADATTIDLSLVERDLTVAATADQLRGALSSPLAKLTAGIDETLGMAGLNDAGVDAVLMTGGASQTTALIELMAARFGAERLIHHDAFGSVALGLAIDAKRRFA
ncbi:MAG: Hsp70 family protein [Pseudomonadota bacterium]